MLTHLANFPNIQPIIQHVSLFSHVQCLYRVGLTYGYSHLGLQTLIRRIARTGDQTYSNPMAAGFRGKIRVISLEHNVTISMKITLTGVLYRYMTRNWCYELLMIVDTRKALSLSLSLSLSLHRLLKLMCCIYISCYTCVMYTINPRLL